MRQFNRKYRLLQRLFSMGASCAYIVYCGYGPQMQESAMPAIAASETKYNLQIRRIISFAGMDLRLFAG